MKLLRLFALVCCVLSAAFIAADAQAAFLGFNEQGDVVVVEYDQNFECGIASTVNGETAHVEACWITNSPPGYAGNLVAYMTEPSGPAGVISDEIHAVFYVDPGGIAHMTVDFMSDNDSDPVRFVPPGFPYLVEDGTYQLLNLYFADVNTGTPMFLPANIEMRAMSDVEPVSNERTTWSGIKALYPR